MTSEWADALDARLKRNLAAIESQYRAKQDAAWEQKRRQMREPVEPLERETFGWRWVLVAMAIILIVLQGWINDIGVQP